MNRGAEVLLIVMAAMWTASCGGTGGISGSQCDLIDCTYDQLDCQIYAPPNDALKLFFKRTLDEGSEYAAIIVIDVIGLESGSLSGTEMIDQEFVDRVLLYRPGTGEQWPEYDNGKLKVDKGNLEVGATLAGKSSFNFTNGYFASMEFECTLEAADLE